MLHRNLVLSSTVLAAVAAAALPRSVRADPVSSISISSTGPSTEDLGVFTGTVAFGADAFGGGADLAITLTNTSPSANGGYITGLVFNVADIPDNTVTVSYVGAAGDPFQTLANESASPFGVFEFGAALGGGWLGSGSPKAGIAVGQSWTFLFELSGNSESTGNLSASSFMTNDLPTGTAYPIAVRFRGFEDGGSDKVVGGTPTPPQVVPLPAAAWGGLALLGLLGLGKRLRRRDAGADIA